MQDTSFTEPILDPKRRYRCCHVFTDGHRCGSPALREEDLCYYPHASRSEPQLAGRNGYFMMPRIDDRPAIQVALYDILSRLSQLDIEPKRAGMLLYGIQIASSNLGRHEKSAVNTEPVVEEIVSTPFLGNLALIAEMPDVVVTPTGTREMNPDSKLGEPLPSNGPRRTANDHQPQPITLVAVHATTDPQPSTCNRSLKRSISPAQDKQQDRSHQRHNRHHHKHRCVRHMVDQHTGKQREEQPTQSARDAGQARRSPDLVVGKQIGDRAIHVGREKIVCCGSNADHRQCHRNPSRVGNEEARDAEQTAAIHQGFSHLQNSHATPQQGAGSPASGDAADAAHKERNPRQHPNLKQRHMPHAVQIAGNPVPVELDHRPDKKSAHHHGPA